MVRKMSVNATKKELETQINAKPPPTKTIDRQGSKLYAIRIVLCCHHALFVLLLLFYFPILGYDRHLFPHILELGVLSPHWSGTRQYLLCHF